MAPYPTLYTERLILKPLELADAQAIQQQFAQWDVVRYLNALVPWPYPPDGALVYLRDIALPAIARGEEWHWSIRLKSAPEQLIGNISLMDEQDNNRGFWLGPAWQGQGLMAQASAEVTRYWFQDLGRELMRVPKASPNLASRRLSERSGMHLIRVDEGNFVGGRYAQETWEITREQWQRLLRRH